MVLKGVETPPTTSRLPAKNRRHPMPWHWRCAGAALIICFIGEIPQAQARLLNLGGSIGINYSRSTGFQETDAGISSSSVHSLSFEYGLSISGGLYNLGDYSASGSWSETTVNLEGVSQKSRFNNTNYMLSMNLLPQWSPLGLTRQRNMRESDTEINNQSITARDRIDTFGANWLLTLRHMPRMFLNYQQAELRTNSGETIITRSASAFTDGTVGAARVSAGYQFSETGIGDPGPSSRSHGFNLDASSQLTTSLFITADARYSTSSVPANATAPGVNVIQERSFGTSLIYNPPLGWWNGSTSYNYSENPFFNNFRSHSVQGLANLRFNEKTDSGFGARYLHFTVSDARVDSEGADAGLNYRPIFGLTTSAGGGVSMTSAQSAGTVSSESLFQNYHYTLNYARPYQRFHYTASYQLSYGISDTQPSGIGSRNLGNNITFGIDNTNTQIIHVGLNTTYSNVQTVSQSVKAEQSTYLVSLSAGSSYLKSLVFRGDALDLRSQADYSNTTGVGLQGKVISGELHADYQTPFAVSISEGYRIENYPTELLMDRQIITSQVRYSANLISNAHLIISLSDIEEDNRYREDVNRAEGSLSVDYQIAQLTLGVSIMENDSWTAGIRYGSRSIMGRASRSF
jgi:hypothetical protein